MIPRFVPDVRNGNDEVVGDWRLKYYFAGFYPVSLALDTSRIEGDFRLLFVKPFPITIWLASVGINRITLVYPARRDSVVIVFGNMSGRVL